MMIGPTTKNDEEDGVEDKSEKEVPVPVDIRSTASVYKANSIHRTHKCTKQSTNRCYGDTDMGPANKHSLYATGSPLQHGPYGES